MGTQPQNYKCIARFVCGTTEGYNYARSYGNVKSLCTTTATDIRVVISVYQQYR